MDRVAVEETHTQGPGGNTSRRVLTDALGTTEFAINHYRLAPGERLSGGLHAHLDQEEAFYVLSGTVTFDVREEPLGATRSVQLEPSEAVRFAPGEYQTGYNDSEEPVEALGVGAPAGSSDVRVPGPCADCGAETLRLDFGPGQNSVVCLDCGTETEVTV